MSPQQQCTVRLLYTGFILSNKAAEINEIASGLHSKGARLDALSSSQKLALRSPTQLYYCGSPLHWAVTARNLQATRVLLDLGSDPNLKNALNKTPLELAVALHFQEGIELLLPLLKGVTLIDLLFTSIRDISSFFHRVQFGARWMKEIENTVLAILTMVQPTEIGNVAGVVPELLEDAIRRWPTSLVDMLTDVFVSLWAGAAPLESLERPLGLLIERDEFLCFERTLDKFIEHFRFDPNNPILIFAAVSIDRSCYVTRLLELGADPFALCREGFDAFGTALLESNFSTARAILNHSSPVAQQPHFESCGHNIFGVEHGSATLLGRLLSMPQIDESSIDYLLQIQSTETSFIVCPSTQVTALHAVSAALESFHRPKSVKRYRKVLSIVLEHFSQESHRYCLDNYGRSPLHWAVEAINIEAVIALLDSGADPNNRGPGTETALEVSYSILNDQVLGQTSGHRLTQRFQEVGDEGRKLFETRMNEIIDLLREYGAKTSGEINGQVVSDLSSLGPHFDEGTLGQDDFEALVARNSDDIDAISFLTTTPLWEAGIRRDFSKDESKDTERDSIAQA